MATLYFLLQKLSLPDTLPKGSLSLSLSCKAPYKNQAINRCPFNPVVIVRMQLPFLLLVKVYKLGKIICLEKLDAVCFSICLYCGYW